MVQQPVPRSQTRQSASGHAGDFSGLLRAVWYWRELDVPANPHPGGRYVLRFWDVDYLADVWLNGTQIALTKGRSAVRLRCHRSH